MGGRAAASRRLVAAWGAWAWTPCLLVGAAPTCPRDRIAAASVAALRASAECKIAVSVNGGQPQTAARVRTQFMQIAPSQSGEQPQTPHSASVKTIPLLPASTPSPTPPRPPPRRSRAPAAARSRVVAPPRSPAAAPPRRAIR